MFLCHGVRGREEIKIGQINSGKGLQRCFEAIED